MTAAFLFLFGLIIGSFINVVAFRYAPDRFLFNFANLKGRSHCLQCGVQLKWYELVPLFSFLAQKGKCNYCGAKLSWQYPLVELVGGLIFFLPFYLYTPLLPISYFLFSSIIWILVFLFLLIIWVIDYRLYLIPDECSIALALLGLGKILLDSHYLQFGEFQGSFLGGAASLFGLRQNIWINHFGAALIAMAAVGFLIFFTKGKGMGMGDLKLVGALGVLYGWPDVLFIFIFASLIGALASAVLMLVGRKTMKSFVPFGPFLVLGAAITFFFGELLLRSYFNFFGL